MSKKVLIITLLFLSIGFASINTTMYVEGLSKVVFNSDEFKVYFSAVYLDEEDYTNQLLNEEKTAITYTATELKSTGTNIALSYDITNVSTEYDAVLSVTCTSSVTQVNVPVSDESIILNAREETTRGILLSLNETITEDAVITCTIDALPSERVIANTGELIENDTYVLYGTYKDSSDNIIANANLVVYSETPHYITTDENGYLFYNGLEQGVHEIYYVDDTLENIKLMTKSEVIENALSKAEFTTSTSTEIGFLNSSKITNQGVIKTQSFCKTQLGNVYEFDYTGSTQEFTTLCNGEYKIELWGAQGGGFTNYEGGKGAYVSGVLNIEKTKKFYIYIGGNGKGIDGTIGITPGGYNGGGLAKTEAQDIHSMASSGGGATDIRVVGGSWDSFESLKSRIMVAGAGGGSDYSSSNYGYGGAAGGIIAYDGTSKNISGTGIGGNQTQGGYCLDNLTFTEAKGRFGYGGTYEAASFDGANSGMGGSGYYGGGAGHYNRTAGGGGSSFISGHNGCDAITEDSTESNIIHTGQANHYSGYVFTNTRMIDGEGYEWTTSKGSSVVGMPTHDGNSIMTGNSGNGYAKITLVALR